MKVISTYNLNSSWFTHMGIKYLCWSTLHFSSESCWVLELLITQHYAVYAWAHTRQIIPCVNIRDRQQCQNGEESVLARTSCFNKKVIFLLINCCFGLKIPITFVGRYLKWSGCVWPPDMTSFFSLRYMYIRKRGTIICNSDGPIAGNFVY